ncbi:glycosyltransferase [Desulfonema magnum]|uniref:Glycosyltransferase domain-containing protein n=1 Tax=Desulfonema magnum TaxID=45655 RepID=A0A975GWE6_9BACT|nr:glycosyltransferase [Desulfonema magnum]QTA93883.1 Glycosyltransferase domain-containing protein [Desulfonema magnum]
MDERSILFIAYLYPPVGGNGLPGVQRSVKFVRYLPLKKKYVLTLQPDLYPDFFSAINKVPLPINNEVIIRAGAIDIFKMLLKGRNFFTSLLSKKNRTHHTDIAHSEKPAETGISDSGKRNLFGTLKNIISDILTFPDYSLPWMIPAIWQGKALLNQKDIDVIFATGPPWTSLITGWVLRRLTGVRLIIDFRDPWVSNPYVFSKGKLRESAEKYLEQKIVTDADIVLLNTEELKKDFVNRYQFLPENKFVVLINGYDEFEFRDIHLRETKEEESDLLLTHAGSLYGLRDPKPILEAIGKIRERNIRMAEKIKFRQMGATKLDYNVKDFVAKNLLYENYGELGSLPFTECLRHMVGSDILVIIQQDTKTQIPSKIYEYIYLNKPILTISSKDGALGKMIEKYEFGDIFEPHDIEGLAGYLEQKVSDKEKSGTLKVNYEHREAFDVRNIANQLEKIIEDICV